MGVKSDGTVGCIERVRNFLFCPKFFVCVSVKKREMNVKMCRYSFSNFQVLVTWRETITLSKCVESKRRGM